MTPLEHLAGLLGISLGFWLLFCFYSIFSIKRFIVNRYEKESNLTDTIFFKEHFPFYKYQPKFFVCGLYATHLLICVWGWRVYGKRKIFRDIQYPEEITGNFSINEIRRAKRVVIVVGVVIAHCIAIYLFGWIWPDSFA